jgi:hypothetical protein
MLVKITASEKDKPGNTCYVMTKFNIYTAKIVPERTVNQDYSRTGTDNNKCTQNYRAENIWEEVTWKTEKNMGFSMKTYGGGGGLRQLGQVQNNIQTRTSDLMKQHFQVISPKGWANF